MTRTMISNVSIGDHAEIQTRCSRIQLSARLPTGNVTFMQIAIIKILCKKE